MATVRGLHCSGNRRSDEVDATSIRLAPSVGHLGDRLAGPLLKWDGIDCVALNMN